MYESYTRQSLPSKEYREILGTAICVFNSNNAFIIENILMCDNNESWYKLMDKTCMPLQEKIRNIISKDSNNKIYDQFKKICEMRNRIVHSFQCTYKNEQILATKDKQNKQFYITKEYLLDFIKKNEQLSDMLHNFRGF